MVVLDGNANQPRETLGNKGHGINAMRRQSLPVPPRSASPPRWVSRTSPIPGRPWTAIWDEVVDRIGWLETPDVARVWAGPASVAGQCALGSDAVDARHDGHAPGLGHERCRRTCARRVPAQLRSPTTPGSGSPTCIGASWPVAQMTRGRARRSVRAIARGHRGGVRLVEFASRCGLPRPLRLGRSGRYRCRGAGDGVRQSKASIPAPASFFRATPSPAPTSRSASGCRAAKVRTWRRDWSTSNRSPPCATSSRPSTTS